MADLAAVGAEYREKGVAKLPQLLNETQLAAVKRCYDWTRANPSRIATTFWNADGRGTYNDGGGGGKGASAVYQELLQAVPEFAKACQALWDTGPNGNVWFLGAELFEKKGGIARDTPFHQDNSVTAFQDGPNAGEGLVQFWISFEDVPQKNSLEVLS